MNFITGSTTPQVQKTKIVQKIIQPIMLVLSFLFTAFAVGGYSPGDLDNNFGNAGVATIDIVAAGTNGCQTYATAQQPDGKIVAVGFYVDSDGSGNIFMVTRYNIDGSLDTTFGTDGFVTFENPPAVVYGVAIQNDGKIVCVGHLGDNMKALGFRLQPDGSFDQNFGERALIADLFGGTTATFYGVTIQPQDQKIVVTGLVDNQLVVARYTTAGVLDSSTDNDNVPFVDGVGYAILAPLSPTDASTAGYAVALDASANILVVGNTLYNQNNNNYICVARFLTTGALDTGNFGSFGYNLYNQGISSNSQFFGYGIGFQTQGDDAGKIIIAGNKDTDALVMRLFNNGDVDGANFGTSGYFTSNFTGTDAVAYGVAIQSDDTIVIGGVTTIDTYVNTFCAQILANGSDFDTTFAPSTGYTLLASSNELILDCRGVLLQNNGKPVIFGSSLNPANSNFLAARYYGSTAPQGCMNVYYPAVLIGDDVPGFVTNPTNQDTDDYPRVAGLQILSDNSIFVVTGNSAGRNATQLVQLDAYGAALTDVLYIDQSNPTDIIVDIQNRALVIGDNRGALGWIGRYVLTSGDLGTFTPDTAFNSDGTVRINYDFSSFTKVGLRSDGSIVVIGQMEFDTDYCGYVIYDANGDSILYSNLELGNSVAADLLIDSNDVIYILLQTSSGFLQIWSSAIGYLDTDLPYNQYYSASCAFDSAENIIIAAANDETGDAAFRKYDPTGALLVSADMLGGILGYLSDITLQCDTENRPVFAARGNGFVVGRLVQTGSGEYELDTTFAPYSSTPGVLQATYDDSNQGSRLYTLGFASSGSILFGGHEYLNGNNYPTLPLLGQVVGQDGVGQNARYPLVAPVFAMSALSRVYNARFIDQVAQYPELGASGTLDATFNSTEGSVGSIDLINSLSLNDSQARTVVALADGTFLVGASVLQGSAYYSVLAKYTAQGVLDPSYNLDEDDDTTYGPRYLGQYADLILTMMVDVQGRMLVAGGRPGLELSYGWLRRVSADGLNVQTFNQEGLLNWEFIGGLAEQSDGKIIAVGKIQASDSYWYSTVARYNLDGTLDTTFGNNGSFIFNGNNYLPTSTSGIFSVVVDGQDTIYVPYVDGSGNVFIATLASYYGSIVTTDSNNQPITIPGTLNPYNSTIATFRSSYSELIYDHSATFTDNSGNVVYPGVVRLDGSGRGPLTLSDGSYYSVMDPVAITYLNTATPSSIRIAIDANNNVIIGGQVGTGIKVTGVTSAGGTISGFTDYTESGHTLGLYSLLTTQEGSILLGGFDATREEMLVIKLIGAGYAQAGTPDTSFNQSGYNYFNISDGATINDASIFGMSLSPDGRLYAAGYQAEEVASTVTNHPYISRLYNTLYDAQTMQSPATIEQGIQDLAFGQNASQTYQGIVSPFLGNYRASLQQEATAVIEVAYLMQEGENNGIADLLVGANGYTNASNISSMMLTWLLPDGSIDTNFGTNGSGQLLLENETSAEEYLYAMTQSSSGALYIACQANGLAALRKYTSLSTNGWTQGTAAWSVIAPLPDGFYEGNGYGIALQQTNGVNLVLLLQGLYGDGSCGMITAYDAETGNVANGTSQAPTFGDGGSGSIYYNSFDLNMGQLYGAVVNSAGDIFVAYGNNNTLEDYRGGIDVAAFMADGSGLLTEFGTNGVASNVLQSDIQKFWNVNIAAANTGNILVSSCDDNFVNIARLNGVTGQYDTTFNADGDIPGLMSIPLANTNINSLQGISDGSLMVTGYIEVEDAQMFTLRVTADGALDTTFNSQSSDPGYYFNQIGQLPSYFYGLAVQSQDGENQGNLITVGSQYPSSSENQATPVAMRVFGQPGTTAVKNYPVEDQYPGTLDLQLNGTGYQDLTTLISDGSAQVVFAYPDDNEFQGKLLIGIDNGTTTVIARVDQTYMTLDYNFGDEAAPFGGRTGIYTVENNLQGLNFISIDANNNILIGGTSPGDSLTFGWAQQLSPDGTSAIPFDIQPYVTQLNSMAQQKSGRYIVGCSNLYGQNFILAFQNQLVNENTMLALDLTFNPLGGEGQGSFSIDTVYGGIYGLAINDDDTILAAGYQINDDDTILAAGYQISAGVQIAKIEANGSGFDLNFGSNGIATTEIVADSPSVVRLVIDSDENIIVAASCDIGITVQAIRYTSDGVVDANWNTFHGSGGIKTITGLGTEGVTLTAVLATENNQTIYLGNNESDTPNGYLFAARLTSDGTSDGTWNPYGYLDSDYTGVLTFVAGTNYNAYIMGQQAWIGISGNVWTTAFGDDDTPTLIEIVGDSGVQQIVQDPLAAPAGTLDYTLDPSGALSLGMQFDRNFGLPAKLSILSDQSMILAYYTEGTYITKINPILQLDTNFNSDPGQYEVAGSVYLEQGPIHDLFVADAQGDEGSIFVVSGTDYRMQAAKISADGSTVTELTATNSLTTGGVIRQTPAGKVLIAGYAQGTSTGILAEFSADMTTLNTSFGNGGYCVTNSDSPIYAMTVDDQGLIYVAFVVNVTGDPTLGTVYLQRILADGSALDPNFGEDGQVIMLAQGSSYSQTQIKLELDIENGQIVVAVYEEQGEFIEVHRFNTDGNATGDINQIYISGESLQLSSLFFDTNQNIYVVGYNSAAGVDPNPGYQTLIARIKSDSSSEISMDETYGVAGIANIVAGPFTGGSNFYIAAGILDQDGRVYVVGSGSDYSPYMARFFGDNYYTQVSQAIPIVIPSDGPASFDDTYGTAGIQDASAGVGSEAGQQARGILPITTGTNIMTVIANADGSLAWTARQLADGSNDDTYTSPGSVGNGIAIDQAQGAETIQGMVFDGSGNTIIFGGNVVYGGFIKSILPFGLMNAEFGTGSGFSYFTQFDTINAVAQLTNGNFVCVGNKSNVGIFAILNPIGIITTSSIQSFGANISSVSIDADNNIYIAVGSGVTDNAQASVIKLSSTGIVIPEYSANNILLNVKAPENIRLVLDANNQVVVAASASTTSGSVDVIRLNYDGSIDESFNQLSIPFGFETTAIVTSLVALQNGNVLVSGYQYDASSQDNLDYEFVASVLSDGQFDTTFNTQGSPAGLLTFQVAPSAQDMRNLWAMSVQNNGAILLAGSEESLEDVSSPLTMRLDGYPGVKAIKQFIGAVPVVPSLLNPIFNQTGIAFTDVIANLVDGGSTVVDSQARVLIGGRTSDNTLVVARFLPNGTLDPAFNGIGIAATPEMTGLLSGDFVTVDSNNNVYVGGLVTDTFVVARFLGIDGSLDTQGFNAQGISDLEIPGIAQSEQISNLNNGGYVSIDSSGNVVVGGSTSDNQLAVVRFTSNGYIDETFGDDLGIALSGAISGLVHGGSVATAQSGILFEDDNSIHVGGVTSEALVYAKFDDIGTLSFISETPAIAALVDGGPIALDSNRNLLIGGYTNNQVFVVARFLTDGYLDEAFNPFGAIPGIAYSSALSSLDSCSGLCVDTQNNVLVGGISTAYDGVSNSMVIARLTPSGFVDSNLSSNGLAFTGIIEGLVSGGFVATSLLDNPFVGGYDGTKLVVAEMYSGAEIFVNNASNLQPDLYKIYWYGNIPAIWKNYLAIDVFAQIIENADAQTYLVEQLNASLNQYALIYAGQPNLNLLTSTTPGWDNQLAQLEVLLVAHNPESESQIHEFFVKFNARRTIIHNQLAGTGNQVG